MASNYGISLAAAARARYYTGHMETQPLIINSSGPADTEALGLHIGRRLRGGEVIELSSDLGGGKTTLVRGIVSGTGSRDHVASPTFTISKEYTVAGENGLHIHHFDFYRLPEAGTMAHELAELIQDSANVIIIEWSDVVQKVLPVEHVKIALQRVKSGEDDRRLVVEVPEALAYLTDGLASAESGLRVNAEGAA